jgi:hypothetical protein
MEFQSPRGGLDGTTLVSARVRRRLLPRHSYALAGVLLLGAVWARSIERAPETYLESGTVVVAAQNMPLTSSPYATVSKSLVTTGAVLVESLKSPRSQALVRAAGGTTDFDLTLVNFNNQDYPEYSYPLATLTTQSTNPDATHRTFVVVFRVLQRLLTERQVYTSSPGRISMQLVGDSGPVVQPDSSKRSLAALVLLTAIAVGLISRFLTRHQDRLDILFARCRRCLRLGSRSARHQLRRDG